jgi:hypothetical protein
VAARLGDGEARATMSDVEYGAAMIAIVPLLILIVGLLLYVLASNAKVAEIGRITFACGMLVTTYVTAAHVVRLF